jgi:hypothetical protein
MNPILPSITATSLRDKKKGYPKHKCCGNKKIIIIRIKEICATFMYVYTYVHI